MEAIPLTCSVARHQCTRPGGVDRLQFDARDGCELIAGPPVSVGTLLTDNSFCNVMPFCVDRPQMRLILLEVSSVDGLKVEPFHDRAIPKLATGRAWVVSFADLICWSESEGACPALPCCWVWNTGRCGSTLVHRALTAAGCASISEPSWFDEVALWAQSGTLPAPTTKLVHALHALAWRFQLRVLPHAGALAINPKNYGHHAERLVRQAFPCGRHLFLYRDGVSVVESFLDFHSKERQHVPRPPPAPQAMRSPTVAAELARKGLPTSALLARVAYVAITWADAVAWWRDEGAVQTGGLTLRMDELIASASRADVVHRLLAWACLPPSASAAALSTFEHHSQTGQAIAPPHLTGTGTAACTGGAGAGTGTGTGAGTGAPSTGSSPSGTGTGGTGGGGAGTDAGGTQGARSALSALEREELRSWLGGLAGMPPTELLPGSMCAIGPHYP
jgi:hypothetical protein